MRREIITTDRIAPSARPFSAAVRAGDLLFLSGQVALDPATGELAADDIGAQTEQIFANISAVLSIVAMKRWPSCLISCSQPGPVGGS